MGSVYIDLDATEDDIDSIKKHKTDPSQWRTRERRIRRCFSFLLCPVPFGRPEARAIFSRLFTVDAILFISNKYRLSILHANDHSVLMQMTEKQSAK